MTVSQLSDKAAVIKFHSPTPVEIHLSAIIESDTPGLATRASGVVTQLLFATDHHNYFCAVR